MDVKKKHRKVLRGVFTRAANELEQLLSSVPLDVQRCLVVWDAVESKFEELKQVDSEIYEGLLEESTEEVLAAEMDSSDSYRRRYIELRLNRENLMGGNDNVRNSVASVNCGLTSNSVIMGRRKFKLPTIEFKKFDGNIRDWLSFWSQFKKIHEDPNIDDSDKIEYLVQATVPNSRARRLVESFPTMGENYNKIIEGLKSRFGREDLQIEVYVRQLLNLILKNAMTRGKVDLSTLYDTIETQLRALETLGITSRNCAAILFPLIESCLPQDLLRAWQRSRGSVGEDLEATNESTLKGRLDNLLNFLKNEVESEQRISLAAEGFGLFSNTTKKGRATESNKRL